MKPLTADEISGLHQAMGKGRTTAKPVRPYDLARPNKLSRSKSRVLERISCEAAQRWAEALALVLGEEVALDVTSIEPAARKDCEDLGIGPCAMLVADTDAVKDAAFIAIPGDLALQIVNRMAGGGARAFETRPLTQVETSILKRFLSRFCDGLSQAWPGATFRPALRETPGDAGRNPDEALVHLACRVGGRESEITIAIRAELLETLKEDSKQRAKPVDPAVGKMLGSVPVEVTADLGHARVTLQDVLGVRVGDIVKLDRAVSEPIAVRIAGKVGFCSRPGVVGNRLSVQIKERMPDADAGMVRPEVGASENTIEE